MRCFRNESRTYFVSNIPVQCSANELGKMLSLKFDTLAEETPIHMHSYSKGRKTKSASILIRDGYYNMPDNILLKKAGESTEIGTPIEIPPIGTLYFRRKKDPPPTIEQLQGEVKEMKKALATYENRTSKLETIVEQLVGEIDRIRK